MRIYSTGRAKKIVEENASLIDSICSSCCLPPAYLKAVLLMEIPQIDLKDVLADAVVKMNWLRYSLFHVYTPERHTRNPLRKFDSSTGYGQIFARVAIEAILFAEERDIIEKGSFSAEKLSPQDPDSLRYVWKRLNSDKVFNLSCSALNIIHAACQMTGRVDFGSYNEREKKLIFSRYNGNVKHITAYGEEAYRHYIAM